jgi:hypothetical protein
MDKTKTFAIDAEVCALATMICIQIYMYETLDRAESKFMWFQTNGVQTCMDIMLLTNYLLTIYFYPDFAIRILMMTVGLVHYYAEILRSYSSCHNSIYEGQRRLAGQYQ